MTDANPKPPGRQTVNIELVAALLLLCHPVVLWVGSPRLKNTRYFFTQPNLDQRLIRNVAFVCRVLYVRQQTIRKPDADGCGARLQIRKDHALRLAPIHDIG